MSDQQHPDPITEGFVHSGQRLVQIVTVATALHQGYARRTARLEAARQARDVEAERAETKARRAEFKEARSRWSRAHDRTWLRQAGLMDVAQAWGAAVPYADGNASAASAVGKCEGRLRDLHPHAMTHYDRFRAEGKDPLVAMKEAAPFFTRRPDVRTGDPAPARAQLDEGTDVRWAASVHGPHRSDWEEARREQRAHHIADRLKADHDPGPGELRTILETTTNLSDEVITKVAPVPEPAAQARLAADGFPYSIHEALEMSTNQQFETAAARKASAHTPDRNRRRNL